MIIHRYWNGPYSDLNAWTEQVFRSLHPNDEIKTWGPGDWDVSLDQVKIEDQTRHESNVVRYKALNSYGGMWVDFDLIPLCNLFESTSLNWVAGLGNHLEGCAMRFETGHPFLIEAINKINAAPISNNRSCDVSGASLLNRITIPIELEQRVLPVDSSGRWLLKSNPIAIHLWDTSRKRFQAINN